MIGKMFVDGSLANVLSWIKHLVSGGHFYLTAVLNEIPLSRSPGTFNIHVKFHGRSVRSRGTKLWTDKKDKLFHPYALLPTAQKFKVSRSF